MANAGVVGFEGMVLSGANAEYTLTERLKVGGQAEVWLGTAPVGEAQSEWAVRLESFSAQALERAELANQVVRSPGLAEVVDVISRPAVKPQIVATVMRHLPGTTLRAVRENLADSLGSLDDVVRGLSTLHELGLAHGDVSPANIQLQLSPTSGYSSVLLDYGSLERVGAARRSPAMATKAYASTNLRAGKPADSSDDLYSFAKCILFVLGHRVTSGTEDYEQVTGNIGATQLFRAAAEASWSDGIEGWFSMLKRTLALQSRGASTSTSHDPLLAPTIPFSEVLPPTKQFSVSVGPQDRTWLEGVGDWVLEEVLSDRVFPFLLVGSVVFGVLFGIAASY